MENEQFGNQLTSSEIQADKEWSEFERDLDILGRQLAALQVHTATLGTDLVSSLEARFNEVKTRAQNLQQARQAELDQVRQTAWQHTRQAESAFSEDRMRSTRANFSENPRLQRESGSPITLSAMSGFSVFQ